MSHHEIYINVAPGETRLALVEDGRLVEVLHHRPTGEAGDEQGVGAIHLGRVAARAPELKGVFVDIGGPRPGLLADAKGGRRLKDGDAVAVEVLRAASDDKGPRLAARDNVDATGRVPRLIAPAPDPIGIFLRARVQSGWRVIADDRRLRIDGIEIAFHSEREPIFATHDIEAQLEAALQPVVPFGDAASLVIEETAALTAIDVNSGPRGGALAINLKAAREVARQLRLRNIGGQILVDLLPLKDRDQRARVVETLRAAAADDPHGVHVFGITRLGLAELTRRRVGESLAARLGAMSGWRRSAHSGALDLLRTLDEQARCAGTRRVSPAVSPAIHALLEGALAATLAELVRRHALDLTLPVDAALAAGDYRL